MTLLHFTRPPQRAIEVRRKAGTWVARYAGDQWTKPFRTEPGELRWVLDALKSRSSIRRGLPIRIHLSDAEVAA